MIAIVHDNRRLRGVLPKEYAKRSLGSMRLGQIVDLINGIGLGDSEARKHDVIGRVYEYFLGRFANAEGKAGGEFYTPRPVVGIDENGCPVIIEYKRHTNENILSQGALRFRLANTV